MNPEQLPQEENNVEAEALVQLGMEGNDTTKGIEANTEAAAVKLNDIEQNQEAQLLQSMKSTKDMIEAVAPSLKAQERMANIFSSLMTNLEGPPGEDGKTPQKGIDYFTKQEIESFKKSSTPVKGRDYFTPKETASFKKEMTPVKGKDYFDGKDGYTPIKGKDYFDGVDGRTPMFVSKTAPQDAKVGDLWYQP